MKISELVKLLEEEKTQCGDVEVFINGSNQIYLNPLPWYYDGGGDMLIDGKWYSTRFNKEKSGDRLLHLDSITFEYGANGEAEYYDGVFFPEIGIEDFEAKYKEAKEKYQRECRKIAR